MRQCFLTFRKTNFMRLTLIRLLLIVLFTVLAIYIAGLSKHEALLTAFVLEYVIEPLISEKLR